MKKILSIVVFSYLLVGCSLLQHRYADRAKIEEDHSTSTATQVTTAKTEVKNTQSPLIANSASSDTPLITEANIVDQTTYQPTIAQVETKVEEIKQAPTTVVQEVVKNDPTIYVGDTKVKEQQAIETSNTMVKASFNSIPSNAILYVETVACDAPLVYNTTKLTNSITDQYSKSNKYRMASADSIKALRSKLEYRDVANGDWSILSSLARAQKYDYVFYGAVGKENNGLYLTYYLIRVDSGEIVWESTKSVK